ncbi:homocysteine S-methyltransferase family protein [uncultured Eubacterium sp.]|uniref:homocysteine S-methyltransferase family protein n=1 Tax=uncultured Eubacterium sp. TaxID=165185 RepID=UPI0025F9785B|nr:homocysteine S-methyltransferase family protein [uncultured Eubacterium sp.]
MTREELYGLLEKGPVFLDGATGSNLQKAGMPTGVCPEQWILDHPDVIVDLQKRYIEAGTQILYAPTFSGNRIKLEEYGLADKIVEINTKLVQLCKEAAGDKGLVCGDMTMTGESLEPMGDLELEELIDIYKEQAKILYEAGVDLFVVETMMSLAETRAAVLAIKETCDLPVMVSMTFDEKGKTLYGNTPEGCMVVLQSLGADVVGINCSTGPEKMAEMVRQMKKYANVPILAKPNAGLPQMVDGETMYDMGPEEFASFGPMLMEAGASVLGGCCGTTPEHIARLVETTKDIVPVPVMKEHKRVLASERALQEIDINGPFLVIGERINPTGKKALQESLRQGSMDVVCDMAEEQEEMGAHILDINMGMNGIDEKAMMLEAIEEVTMTTTLPLCIDSSHVDIIEAALRRYPGRALINSISLEREKFEKLLPIAKKYGAMFILLPLSDAGLPKDINEKKEIIHKILDRALELGMCKEDIVVDGLVATVGANKNAALDTLATIRYCKEELGLATVGGLSNISFGLPNRGYVNAAFVTMALQSGLTMAIANPSSDIMMNLAAASDLLLNKTGADLNYINRMADFDAKKKTESVKQAEIAAAAKQDAKKEVDVSSEKNADETSVAHSTIYKAVLNGSMKSILDEVKAGLAAGIEPGVIVSEELIPAINEVGDLFEQQKYFLPQLIASAETMKKAIEYLEPMLSSGDETGPKVTIIIATVEGDIHDIGKNLVALMLKNYGFRVVDLGKDVPKETIVQAAIDENADIIALSALMTTTMMRMKDVVELVREKNVNAKVIIGGAVITQSYADEIGADGYSKDAADAVRLVQRLMGLV